jgi:hypothetical protein
MSMTIEQVATKWVGRSIYGSSDHRLNDAGKNPRPVTDVHYSEKFGQYVAFAGEHHCANSPEALDRRLESLAVRPE